MKKAIILVLALSVIALAGGRGYGGFVLSYMMPDLTALSDEFDDHGLPEMGDYVITYGGGGWGGGGSGKSHLMFGGWGFGGSRQFDSPESDSIPVSVKMTYSGGFFDPGYFIHIWKGFGIVPSVGIGGTSVNLKLRPNLGDVDFGDLLDNPGRTSEVDYTTFTVAPSLSILIPIEFVAIQLRGGYMWSPFQGKWELADGANLRNAPEINPSGIYAQAGILFGGGD